MPTVVAQAVLFLSSYAPLFLVFALLDSFGRGLPSIVCLVAAGLSVIGLYAFFQIAKRQKRTSIPVAHTRLRDGDTLAYFATYLVPFIAAQPHGLRDRAALALFLLTIGVLYVRSTLFYVNPLLSLVGFRTFEVETESGRPMVLLTRRGFLRQAEQVHAAQLSDYVFLELESCDEDRRRRGSSTYEPRGRD
jgi:hypothetical protein